MRFLSLGGAAGPVLFATAVVVSGALRPEYSHVTRFMSELGEAGGSRSYLMNYGGFIPTGLLLIGFSVSLFRSFARTRTSVLGALLVGAFGAGIMAAGVFSCDPGCPHEGLSAQASAHQIVSYVAFGGGIFAPLVWASCFRRLNQWRSLWVYSLLSGCAAIILLALTGSAVESRALAGVWQRAFISVLFLWCAVVGVRAFRLGAAQDQLRGLTRRCS